MFFYPKICFDQKKFSTQKILFVQKYIFIPKIFQFESALTELGTTQSQLVFDHFFCFGCLVLGSFCFGTLHLRTAHVLVDLTCCLNLCLYILVLVPFQILVLNIFGYFEVSHSITLLLGVITDQVSWFVMPHGPINVYNLGLDGQNACWIRGCT